jgi:hypothetical protein
VIETGHSKIIKKNHLVFPKDQKQFIVPMKIYLDHFYDFNDDFCLNATFLKIKTESDFILFDSAGQIHGITQYLFKKIFHDRKTPHEDKIALVYRNVLVQFIIPEILVNL